MAEPILVSAQLALFLKDQLIRPDELAYSLYAKIKSFQNIIPEIVPFSPAKTPSAFISNQDECCSMGITNSRIDLYYQNNFQKIEPTYSTFQDIAKTIIHEINLDCFRIGVITAILYPGISSDDYLSDMLVNKKNALDIQLSYNRRFEDKNKQFNKVYKLYSGNATILNTTFSGLVIERDINNVPTDKTLSTVFLEHVFNKYFNPTIEYNKD